MDLPYHLKTLPANALDVIRFLGQCEGGTADKVTIQEAADLSEIGFGKVIRRLVTKGYVVMDGNQIYRLTDTGHNSVEELAAYDAAGGDDEPDDDDEALVQRRLVLVVPRQMAAGVPTPAVVGLSAGAAFDSLAHLIVRLSVINGEPAQPEDLSFPVGAGHVSQTVEITPGRYTRVRVRLEGYQLGDNPGDIHVCGGMYVDLDVIPGDQPAEPLVAYGADIAIARLD